MRGLGTLINVLCIIVGGVIGCIIGDRLKKNIRETLMTMTGVGVVVLGIGGTMEKMLSITDGKLNTGGTIMMVVSLAIGTVIGELLQIEEKVKKFGEWLKVKSHSTTDNSFVNGFVSASCTVCIGAMAVIGAIQDGISGDYSILAAKGVIDAIIICVMAAAQGKGCVFSAFPVGIWQGLVTVIALLVGNFLPAASLDNLSYVGSILILCVGLNLVREKQIRVANVLPSIVVAVIFGLFA